MLCVCVWCVVCSVRCVVCGVRCVCGVWCAVCSVYLCGLWTADRLPLLNPLMPVFTLLSHRNNIVLVILSSTGRRERVNPPIDRACDEYTEYNLSRVFNGRPLAARSPSAIVVRVIESGDRVR